MIDVTQHGVRPNTGLSVTEAFAAVLAAHRGEWIYVPAGRYKLKHGLLPSGTRLTGDGAGTIFERLDGTTNYILKNANTAGADVDVQLADFTLDGTMDTDLNPGFEKFGLILDNVTGFSVTRLTIRHCTDGGLVVRGRSRHGQILQNRLIENSINREDGQANLAIVDASDLFISQNYIEGPRTRLGIDLEPNNPAEYVDNIVLSDNQITGCGMAAIGLTTNTGAIHRVTMRGNVIRNCNEGPNPSAGTIDIELETSQRSFPFIVIAHNVMYGGSHHGIAVRLGEPASALCAIQGNTILSPGHRLHNTYDGIYIGLDRNTVVQDNIIASFAGNKMRHGVNVRAVQHALKTVSGNVVLHAASEAVAE